MKVRASLMFVGLVACAAEGTSSGTGAEIGAAGGRLDFGSVHLVVPPGALHEPTFITVESVRARDVPNSGNLLSAVYDFGPDGLVFDAPVTLTFDVDKSSIASNQNPFVAFVDGDRTVDLQTTVGRNTITATTTHFTDYGVWWSEVFDTCKMQDLSFTIDFDENAAAACPAVESIDEGSQWTEDGVAVSLFNRLWGPGAPACGATPTRSGLQLQDAQLVLDLTNVPCTVTSMDVLGASLDTSTSAELAADTESLATATGSNPDDISVSVSTPGTATTAYVTLSSGTLSRIVLR